MIHPFAQDIAWKSVKSFHVYLPVWPCLEVHLEQRVKGLEYLSTAHTGKIKDDHMWSNLPHGWEEDMANTGFIPKDCDGDNNQWVDDLFDVWDWVEEFW